MDQGKNIALPNLSRRDLLIRGGLTTAALMSGAAKASGFLRSDEHSQPEVLRKSFKPGEVWLDTSGKPIQAHGGSIITVDGIYYWYGENKEGVDPKAGIWQHGVRFYSSTDLYNWKDLGALIPSVPNDPSSPMHPTMRAERPHILFNRSTNKFVCWIKQLGKKVQTRLVLTADAITGPYTIVTPDLKMLGMSAGDFDLCSNPTDGKAYQYFERVASELICLDLTDDYTNITGYYSTHFPRPYAPLVREAPAHFVRRGKHYLATSGTLGYHPNPSEIASADTFHGPWTVLGDLHPSDKSRTSFNSQITSVFKVPGKKDLYIALADRWIYDLPERAGAEFASGDYWRGIESAILRYRTGQPALKGDMQHLAALPGLDNADTSKARYVWLPIRFDGDKPVIDWREEWTLEEFA